MIMANLGNFDVARIMEKVSEFAPFMLLILAFGTFFGVGVFLTDYYTEVLSPRFHSSAFAMALFMAIIHEAVRFGLLVASIRDFSDSKSFNGWLGLVASIALVWHDVTVAGDVAALWANEVTAAATYKTMLVFLILLGLVLEIRLILTVDNTSLGNPLRRKSTRHAGNGVPSFTFNGNGNQ